MKPTDLVQEFSVKISARVNQIQHFLRHLSTIFITLKTHPFHLSTTFHITLEAQGHQTVKKSATCIENQFKNDLLTKPKTWQLLDHVAASKKLTLCD